MRLAALITSLFISFSVLAQETDSLRIRQDSILAYLSSRVDEIDYQLKLLNARSSYKLYNTENIYTLLKLDTKTGEIRQLQWSLEDDEEFTMTINDVDLSLTGSQFELYPTKNMYQFILLDKTYGRTWHVQWGFGKKRRWIKRLD